MRLSEERVTHIAHLISERIWKDDLVDYTSDEMALKVMKQTIMEYLTLEDRADAAARHKIGSLSKDVPEGSREWDVLYKQYFEEELQKKNF
ncbi:MAG: DUF507 family protein [Thermodesulfobacteriota bacterium]